MSGYCACMSHDLRRILALSSLVFAGCYTGFDLDDINSETGATSTSPTTATPTSGPTSGGTTTESDGSASDGVSATEASTGEPDATTTGQTTNPDPTNPDPTNPDPTNPDPTNPDPTNPDPTNPDPTNPDPTDDPPDDPPQSDDVPNIPYCHSVADWSPQWAQLELDVLTIVNQVRSQGANCGSKGNFGPAGPLTMNTALRCAARKHSQDMGERDYFSHNSPEGQTPWERMGLAGYGGYSAAGENIAAGSPDAAGTMNQWMNSDGHCANVMNPAFKEIGVGYSTGGQWGHLWTQKFGAK